MAQPPRSRSLTLQLDVIVEEDSNDILEGLNILRPNSLEKLHIKQSSAKCTFTLRNMQVAGGDGPQFLHVGRWPNMDMVDDLSNLTDDAGGSTSVVSTGINRIGADSTRLEEQPSSDSDSNIWGFVTSDQLSMVMDYWNPDEKVCPLTSKALTGDYVDIALDSSKYDTMTAAQRSLFLREIRNEYDTRTQTVEHMAQLEDNDNAVEIVAVLEGYRQNGWADEMIKAFPQECWLFWSNNFVESILHLDHSDGCSNKLSLISDAGEYL